MKKCIVCEVELAPIFKEQEAHDICQSCAAGDER